MSDDIRSLVKTNADLYRAVENAQEDNRQLDKEVIHVQDVMTLDAEVIRTKKKKKKTI